jgi:xylulokinase
MDVFTTLTRNGNSRVRLVASGGGAASQLWRHILADTFDCEVVTKEFGEDASALGAGIVAGVSRGVWASEAEAAALIRVTNTLQPDSGRVRLYRELLRIYQSLYPGLTGAFDRMARVMGGIIA